MTPMWDFRILGAQVVPDHTTIARFRQSHPGGVADLFVQVLTLAAQAGLGRVGVVAVDGPKIAANASVGANRKSSWLREQVDQMIVAAEQADAAEDAMFVDGSGDRFRTDGPIGPRASSGSGLRWHGPSNAPRTLVALIRPRCGTGRTGCGSLNAMPNGPGTRPGSVSLLLGPRRQVPVEGTARPAGTYPASPDEYEQVRQARTRVERNQKRRDKAVADAADRAPASRAAPERDRPGLRADAHDQGLDSGLQRPAGRQRRPAHHGRPSHRPAR